MTLEALELLQKDGQKTPVDPALWLSLKDLYRGTLTLSVSTCVDTEADWDELLAWSDLLVVQSASFWMKRFF